MIYLRPIQKSDLEGLINLNALSSVGMTTFPKDRRILEQKVFHSTDSFQKLVTTPDDELYLFVLEDSQNHEIIGISAVFATTGQGEAHYFFRRETITSNSALEAVVKHIPTLAPISYLRAPSEICSLFLHPDKRKHGLGKLLSLGRFHFMAAHPERFTDSLYTELRGFIENGTSIFWEGIGKHFFNMSFAEALELLKYSRSFMEHFIPKHPIYIPLLPKEVQAVIGKTHPSTEAALAMLLHEGFEITDEIDIFDGGPKLKALKKDVRTIRESKLFQVVEIQDAPPHDSDLLLSNCRLNFRACLGTIKIKEPNSHTDPELFLACIPSAIAEALQVGLGDIIRASPLHKGA